MKKITVKDVLEFINFGSTVDQRIQIARALNDARAQDNHDVGRSLHVGMPVQFVGKYGVLVLGTVIKINPKSIHIKETSTSVRWRVTPALVKPQNPA